METEALMQDQKPARAVRDSNFELLRIIAIILIVAHHMIRYSDLNYPADFGYDGMGQYVFSMVLDSYGEVGAIVFIMITGYFLADGEFKPRRLARLATEVWFYSYAITIALMLLDVQKFDWTVIRHMMFPIILCEFWFVSYYMVILLISPAINIAMRHMSAKQHAYLLCALLTVSFAIPTMLSSFQFCELLVLLTGYVFAAFLKLHPQKVFDGRGIYALLLVAGVALVAVGACVSFKYFSDGIGKLDARDNPAFLIYILVSIIAVAATALSDFGNKFKLLFAELVAIFVGAYAIEFAFAGIDGRDVISASWSVFSFVMAAALFILFKNIRMGPNRAINTVAASALGVYIISDQMFLRQHIWGYFNLPSMLSSPWFYAYALDVVAAVFLMCIAVDLVRRYAVFGPLSGIGDRIWSWACRRFARLDSEIDQVIE